MNHRVRRAAAETGTMFGGASTLATIGRLLRFSARALQEAHRFRHDINSGRRPLVAAREV